VPNVSATETNLHTCTTQQLRLTAALLAATGTSLRALFRSLGKWCHAVLPGDTLQFHYNGARTTFSPSAHSSTSLPTNVPLPPAQQCNRSPRGINLLMWRLMSLSWRLLFEVAATFTLLPAINAVSHTAPYPTTRPILQQSACLVRSQLQLHYVMKQLAVLPAAPWFIRESEMRHGPAQLWVSM
jgi:hypothetical protein